MAYQYLRSKDEDDNQQNLLGPSQSVLTQGGNNSATSVNNSAKTGNRSQQYGNINHYLQANQGNSGNLSNAIVGDLDKQQNQLRSDINTNYGDFQNKVQQGINADTNNLANEAEKNALNVMTDPTKSQQFQQLLKGEYQGPQTYDPTYQNSYQAYADSLKNFKTDSGRSAYLQQKGGTVGKNKLNSALLSNDQNALGRINNYSDTVTDLKKQTEENAQKNIEQAKQVSQQTAQQVQSQLGNTLAGYKTKAQENLEKQKLAERQNQMQLQESLKKGSTGLQGLSQSQLDQLGLKKEDVDTIKKYQDLGGISDVDLAALGNFSVNDPNNLTVNNTISDDQRAQANALASLLGQPEAFTSAPSSFMSTAPSYNASGALSSLRNTASNNILKNAQKEFGDKYYENIGQHSGQGFAPAQGRRSDADIKAFVENYLKGDQAPTPESLQEQFYFGADPNAWGGAGTRLLEQLNQAKTKYRGL